MYPFAAILRIIPSKYATLKHLTSFLGGLFLVQWVFGKDWIHSFVSSYVTYILCFLLPGKYKASGVFVFVMGYMLLSHIYRMYVSYLSGIFDFTGTQMVLTMKLTSFAYNLYDGTVDKARVFPVKPYDDKKKQKLFDERKRFAITSLPNVLAFSGYIFCFTCILAGPAFEYNDYIRSIDGTAFVYDDENVDDDKIKASSTAVAKVPSSWLSAGFTFLIGLVCLVLHLIVGGKFPLSKIYDPGFIASTPHVPRYLYTCVALFGDRLKYYFAWKIAEGCLVRSINISL